MGEVFHISDNPVYLGAGGRTEVLPSFGMDAAPYAQRNAEDGGGGRLMAVYTFTEDWDIWEVHHEGDELVMCLDGAMTVHQERDGEISSVRLTAGQAVINEPGTWHTADIAETATALFVMAGVESDHRPRRAPHPE
ncbi:MAG: cupin domain-containing protein [Actinomycetota bacterium]